MALFKQSMGSRNFTDVAIFTEHQLSAVNWARFTRINRGFIKISAAGLQCK
jgi:hypothetical protein